MDINEEARKTFESVLEDFAEMKSNLEDEEKRESMEYDREEIDNRVYGIRKVTTFELQLGGGGPAYWIVFDVVDDEIENVRFKYAWWSSPVVIDYSNMTDSQWKLMEWFVEEFCGGDVDWLYNYN